MTSVLLVLMLGQTQSLNLNQQPVMVQDEGVRQGTVRAVTVNCTGAGVTCTQSGSTWTLAVDAGTGGVAGKVAEAYMADASIMAQVAGSAYAADASVFAVVSGSAYSADASYSAQVATVAAVAYSADASFYSTEFIANPTDCGGGQYATAIAANGNLTCSTPPSGSGNGGIATVAFGSSGRANEDSDPLMVTASWVTASSAIVFTPACSQVDGGTATADECRVVYPECAVTEIVASTSFTMQCRSETGGYGQYPISYLGL